MDDTVRAPGPADALSDEVVWRSRLAENQATMAGLRQDAARVSEEIAETERAVASTLRRLAVEDRERGRTAAADRREARAQDAERFAARESKAAGEMVEQHPASGGSDHVHP